MSDTFQNIPGGGNGGSGNGTTIVGSTYQKFTLDYNNSQLAVASTTADVTLNTFPATTLISDFFIRPSVNFAGGPIDGSTTSDAVFTGLINVTADGNSLTGTVADENFDLGAVSSNFFVGTGYVECVWGINDTNSMIVGITYTDPMAQLGVINFGLSIDGSNIGGQNISINEGNDTFGPPGAAVPGDVFRVQANGTVVTYYINDVLVYTSTNPFDPEQNAYLGFVGFSRQDTDPTITDAVIHQGGILQLTLKNSGGYTYTSYDMTTTVEDDVFTGGYVEWPNQMMDLNGPSSLIASIVGGSNLNGLTAGQLEIWVNAATLPV